MRQKGGQRSNPVCRGCLFVQVSEIICFGGVCWPTNKTADYFLGNLKKKTIFKFLFNQNAQDWNLLTADEFMCPVQLRWRVVAGTVESQMWTSVGKLLLVCFFKVSFVFHMFLTSQDVKNLQLWKWKFEAVDGRNGNSFYIFSQPIGGNLKLWPSFSKKN